MLADRSPNLEDTGLALPLGWLTGLVVRQPKAVLLFACLLAAVSLLYTAQFLGFRTSRLDLLNPADDFNKRWLAYLEEFGREDDAVVVFEAGEGAGKTELTAAIDDLADAVNDSPEFFHSLFYKRDLTALRSKGLYYASPEQLARLDAFTARLEGVVQSGDWNRLGAAAMLAELSAPAANAPAARGTPAAINPPAGFASPAGYQPPDGQASPAAASEAEYQRVIASLSSALADPPQYRPLWPEQNDLDQLEQLDSRYLLSRDGRLGFLLLRIKQAEERFDGGTQAIDELRRMIERTQSRHRGVTLGLTGMPVLENDEMRTSQDDMIRATLLSLVGVAGLFVAGFGGLRHPLLTVLTLLLAMAWSFGYVTLMVGHLNILSVAFGVILIGLGIDFGIHYVARYLQLRKTVDDSGQALVQTASSVGPGIITGGLTTALAFCTAAMTRFTGIAELGVIAGGGILLCILAALLVLPAMIQLSDARRSGASLPSPLPLDVFLQPMLRSPRRVLLVGLAVIVVVSAGAVNLRYDHNLLNLQPKGIESVRVEEKLLAQSDRSVWFALSMADSPEQLRRRKAQFERLASVDRIEEIVSLLPETDAAKTAAITRIARRLARLPATPPQLAPLDARQLAQAFAAQGQSLGPMQGAAQAAGPSAEFYRRVQQLGPQLAAERLSAWQRNMMAELWGLLALVRSAASLEPPSPADIPPALSERFVGKHGHYLMKVYARGDVWDMAALTRFVADVSRVDPKITGHPIQTYHASRQMQHSYIHAAIYSLLAVLIVLMLDFRSVRSSLLAIMPMGLGMLMMFGLLGLCDIPLNPANMIVLPLILGIGIDDGVHVVHDFRRQQGPYRLSSSTATAVVITSATTIAGFGSMMIVAKHQGLRSLGQVLTIGVLCCLATSLFILPALLALISSRRVSSPGDQSEDASGDNATGDNADRQDRERHGDSGARESPHVEESLEPAAHLSKLIELRRAAAERASPASPPVAAIETPRRRAG